MAPGSINLGAQRVGAGRLIALVPTPRVRDTDPPCTKGHASSGDGVLSRLWQPRCS